MANYEIPMHVHVYTCTMYVRTYTCIIHVYTYGCVERYRHGSGKQQGVQRRNWAILTSPNQLEVVEAFVKGRDVIAVLPTGYGKSLCFACLPLVFDRSGRQARIACYQYKMAEDSLLNIHMLCNLRMVITFQRNKTYPRLATRPSRLRARGCGIARLDASITNKGRIRRYCGEPPLTFPSAEASKVANGGLRTA